MAKHDFVIIEATASLNDYAPNRNKKVQKLRFWAQLFSSGINIWIGVQFFLWVKYIESQGATLSVSRPPGVEGWLPIGSLLSLRYWFETGIVNDIHPSGMIILVMILITAFVFKKGFCSWVCPVGFISELVGDIADKLWGRRLVPPRWLDYPLRSLKYIILGFFIWAVILAMTPESARAFIYSDYNIVTDILMLRFFTDITMLSLGIITALFLLSFVIRAFWCRYLCPYGALLGLIGLVSPTRIRRDANSCIDCSSCATACPSFIKVDKITEVVSDECTGCMACVDACPVDQTLQLKTVGRKKSIPVLKWAAGLLIVFWVGLLGFKLMGPWENSVTDEQYMQRMEKINRDGYVHP